MKETLHKIQFPDPELADDEGLIAMGGSLSKDFLLSAYKQGLFPWFNEDDPILWWSPNPRMVLFPDNLKISASLKQTLRRKDLCIMADNNFEKVIGHCANVDRRGQDGTWITKGIIKAYCDLHKEGYAHSFETYMNGELVGGLYGISLGKAFFGESMFYLERDASKYALCHLAAFAKSHDFHFIDVQQSTSHLRSLGATDISRKEFLIRLKDAIGYPTLKGKWQI